MYRDRLTLRQVWVRIKALPHDAPLWESWRAMSEQAAADKRVRDVEDALAPFTKPKEG